MADAPDLRQTFLAELKDQKPYRYDITDYDAIRQATYDNVLTAVKQRFPLVNDQYELAVEDVDYEPKAEFGLKEQKEAILNGSSLGRRLKGRWVLRDRRTGDPVSRTNRMTLLNVPYITPRGTYIRNGHEMVINHVMRLVPGAYARRKANGGYEAHVNVEQGTGQQFKVEMDPSSGVFSLRRGTVNARLYPVMRSLGVTDDELRDAWGDELLIANKKASTGLTVQNNLRRLLPKEAAEAPPGSVYLEPPEASRLREELARMKLDPLATESTLGRPHDRVTPSMLLDTSRRLLSLARGESDEDNRDSMEFQKIYGPAEILAERIVKDGGRVARAMLWKATTKRNVDHIAAGALNKHVDGVFNGSGLAQYVDGSSPFDAADASTKLTRLGEGGLADDRMATTSMRTVQGSYKGFVDPVRTAESRASGLVGYFTQRTLKGHDGLLYTQMYNPRTGRREWVDSRTAARSNVATPEYKHSKDSHIPLLGGSKLVKIVPRSEVDYYLDDPDGMFSMAANMVPMKSGIKGLRLNMGCLAPDTRILIRRENSSVFAGPVEEYEWVEGDMAMSLSDDGRSADWREVRGVSVNIKRPAMVEVELDSGRKLVTSLNHIWLKRGVDGGWVEIPAESLAVGDEVPCWMGDGLSADIVVGAVWAEGYDRTYDLDLDDHSFMVSNGIFVHNSKYAIQAVPLVHREPALVQGEDSADPGKSHEERAGKAVGAVKAPKAGVVEQVRRDKIIVRYMDGTKGVHELYDNFPANQKGYLRSMPVVKTGQVFKKGDTLAGTNYTDDKGDFAGGRNLRTAFLNYKGKNFEDAVLISESAAKKLTSEHMYHSRVQKEKNLHTDTDRYVNIFPGKFTAAQLKNMGPDGMIKPGTVVHKGDPLILAVRENEPSPGTAGRRTFANVAETWDHEYPGVVTDVRTGRQNHMVWVRANEPMRVGDKMSNRYGSKGVVAEVVPDSQMPLDKKGKPFEVIMSPLSVVSRTNPSQMLELAYGKIAHKLGKPVKVPSFSDGDAAKEALAALKAHNLSDTEDLIDPDTGKTIPKVLTGHAYYYKLKHTSASKEAGRGTGGYTMDDAPGSGGRHGSKRLGSLETSALVGHGAMEVLKDAKLIRGQANSDFWRDFKLGRTPVMPGAPLVNRKFFEHVKGAGVNVRHTKDSINIFGMTAKDADELGGGREVKSGDTFETNTYRPIDGGLFGKDVFGPDGDQWGYIQLSEPVPNPVMADSLRRALRMSMKDFEAVAEGRKKLEGLTGGKALKKALDKLDLDQEIKYSMAAIQRSSGSKRDDAIKRYRALASMREQGVEPKDFMMTRIPVLPPKFRSITTNGGMTMVADANYMYKALIDAEKDFQEAREKLPDDMLGDVRSQVYRTYKALTGLHDPDDAQLQRKGVGGLLKWVFGKGSPKYGNLQRRVLGTATDVVGRGVATPNPSLKLNQIGLPEEQAWDVYEPFVVKRLVGAGYKATDAVKMVADKTPTAYKALREAVEERPVIMNRAPSLHKFSLMGFWPVLTKGSTLQVSPSIVVPFNLDYDGDANLGTVIVLLPKDLQCGKNNDETLKMATFKDDEPANIEELSLESEKNAVYAESPLERFHKECYNTYNEVVYDDAFWEERKMAFTELNVAGFEEYDCFMVDLEDFPHKKDGLLGSNDNTDFYKVPKGIKVVAMDEETGKPVAATVKGWSRHRDLEIWSVDLLDKRQFLTDDDERAVYGLERGSLEFTRHRPAEAVGMLVPVVKDTTSMFKGDLTSWSVAYAFGNPNKKDPKHVLKKDIDLNRYSGYFFGVMIGDGWVGGARGVTDRVCLAATQPEITDQVIAACDGLFTTNTLDSWGEVISKDSYGKSRRYTLYSPELGRFLEPIIGKGAENKHLPPFWHRTTREFRLGLLSGLLDTDGTVCVTHGKTKPQLAANYGSISLRLVRETQQLLRSLNVHSRVTFGKKTQAGNDFWTLGISALDLYEIKDELNCAKPKIIESFRDAPAPDKDSSAAGRLDQVPFPKEIALAYSDAEYASCPKQTAKGKYGRVPSSLYTNIRGAVSKQRIARGMAKALLKKFPEVEVPQKWIDMVNNTEVAWQEVVKVENTGKVEVGYDLTVPGFETFMNAEGVILSNTVNFHVPVSRAAAREVATKMMPEQNLLDIKGFKAHYKPMREYLHGLNIATRQKNEPVQRTFNTKEEMLRAYRKGEIDVDTPVRVLEKD